MDRAEYRELVIKHKDRVHTLVTWMLHDSHEAQDISQEALTRLWEHHRSVPQAAGGAWLMRTAHRLSLDRIRRNKRRDARSLNGLESFLLTETSDSEPFLEGTDTNRVIVETLSELSSADRAIIVLREIADLSYTEIAEVLERPMSYVRVALHRARKRLRRRLTEVGVRP